MSSMQLGQYQTVTGQFWTFCLFVRPAHSGDTIWIQNYTFVLFHSESAVWIGYNSE
jgi:hypothetical protein